MIDTSQPRPSATVVLLRDNANQLEVLMLRKNQKINYGGSWVFPGGIIDPDDYALAADKLADSSLEAAARTAAARETKEEAGLQIKPQEMLPFAHWVTPKLKMKRYATWFFVADVNYLDQDVVIDEGEITEARWLQPAEALSLQAQGTVQLNGPSFVTLNDLSQFATAGAAVTTLAQQGVDYFKPKGLMTDDGVVTLYENDSAYPSTENGDTFIDSGEQPQHRLYMHREGAWRYVKTTGSD